MTDSGAGDAKLLQYLNEAYGKEKQLETALQAHISMTTRAAYKKRLQQHLKETKAHARGVERQIKRHGGSTGSLAASAQEAANRAAALAQGHFMRCEARASRSGCSETQGPSTKTKPRRSRATPPLRPSRRRLGM